MRTISRIVSKQHELYYHCVTRIVAGEHLFGDPEKAVFQSMMEKVAAFCGIEILTYCIMSNHVHLLCRVPPANDTDIPDVEIMRRYRILYANPSEFRPYHPKVLESLLDSNSADGQKARRLLLNRMHNISIFMKILKTRASLWFNRTYSRFGTLWAEKFKSIVVQGKGSPLLRMAQYIDLNPVRAGMVNVSTDYPFSGLSAAKRGIPSAQYGIQQIAKLTVANHQTRDAVQWYEGQLAVTLRHRPNSAGKSPPDAKSVTNPLLLRQDRFSKSLAMGNHHFLTILMEHFAPAFSQRTLSSGPHKGELPGEDPLFFGRKERKNSPRGRPPEKLDS